MNVGYARVSTHEQNIDLQIDALNAANCEKIFHEAVTSIKADRPKLVKALDFLRPGDALIVWKLDRLGRSLEDLIALSKKLEAKEVGLRSLQEALDTTTPGGKLIFHMFAALAEFERGLIRERTLAGLASARARGRTGGRPRVDKSKIKNAIHLAKTTNQTIGEICESVGISKRTYYQYWKKEAN